MGLGSSPRMRGALDPGDGVFIGAGIIPADAGSTGPHLLVPHGYGDHPRGCGEHRELAEFSALNWGSSPRMRGAPEAAPQRRKHLRIIPADAGSTFYSDRERVKM